MTYKLSAIPDAAVPRAKDPTFQHLLNTYASESNKTFSVWTSFAGKDLSFKPHERSSTILEIMRHQLLSERRFFGEFLAVPEPDAGAVLPEGAVAKEFASRLVELALIRLPFLAGQEKDWWHQAVPFFDVKRERIWIFWRRVLHSAHHRTQVTVYQRLMEETVLPTYGPTADVTWAGADPTLSVEAALRGDRETDAARQTTPASTHPDAPDQ